MGILEVIPSTQTIVHIRQKKIIQGNHFGPFRLDKRITFKECRYILENLVRNYISFNHQKQTYESISKSQSNYLIISKLFENKFHVHIQISIIQTLAKVNMIRLNSNKNEMINFKTNQNNIIYLLS